MSNETSNTNTDSLKFGTPWVVCPKTHARPPYGDGADDAAGALLRRAAAVVTHPDTRAAIEAAAEGVEREMGAGSFAGDYRAAAEALRAAAASMGAAAEASAAGRNEERYTRADDAVAILRAVVPIISVQTEPRHVGLNDATAAEVSQ